MVGLNGSIEGLITKARADGVQFIVEEGELQLGIPKSKSRWRKRLTPHKSDILRVLSGEPIEPEPEEQAERRQKYEPLPIDCFPSPLAKYIRASSKAIGCDPAFIAQPLLACLARAIGNTRTIRLKKTWTEPAIIWAGIVGKSGTHKTPAIAAATSRLKVRQAMAIEEYKQSLDQFEQDKSLYDRNYQEWKSARKTTDPPPWKPEPPTCIRYYTSDATIEAIADLLDGQFDGVLVVRDELAGWINGIAEYKGGKGSDLGHWLACWSAEAMTVDRKTGVKKMIHVPRAAVGIVGGIQPGVLREAIGREHLQDGLCQRLLLAMPDSKPVVWTDEVIPEHVEAGMSEAFNFLFALEPAADADGNEEPFPLDLTPEAKAKWVAYFNRHRAELQLLDDDLAACWSKLEAYAARFALVFQLCSAASGEASADAIDEASIEAGIRLSDWFGNEAKRVYGLFHEDAEDRQLRELVEWVRRRGGAVSPRDVVQGVWRIKKTTDAESELRRLERAGHGEFGPPVTTPKGGRPRQIFTLYGASTSTEPPGTREPEGFVDVDA